MPPEKRWEGIDFERLRKNAPRKRALANEFTTHVMT